jgi:hypothetical protein
MGNPSLDPTALQLFHVLLYCMAYIFGGAAVIALSVYIVLVCSEMFFSQPRSKTQRAKVLQSACRVPVAAEALDLPAAETPILAALKVTAKSELQQSFEVDSALRDKPGVVFPSE